MLAFQFENYKVCLEGLTTICKVQQVLKLLEFYVKLWSFVRTIYIEICYYKLVDFNIFVLVVLTHCFSFFFFFFFLNRKFQKLMLIKTKLLTIGRSLRSGLDLLFLLLVVLGLTYTVLLFCVKD